jgi:DNA-binding transcriptional LysR family regulator
MLERNEIDFTLGYHHPLLTIKLDGRQFQSATLASDKLVPVSRAGPSGAPLYPIAAGKPVPLLAYGPSLALGRLLEDYLAHNRIIPTLQRRIECDSIDALAEYVLKGLGIAWLPWSMVHAECKSGRMALAGDRRMEIRFEVRLYRPKRRLHALAETVWDTAVNR